MPKYFNVKFPLFSIEYFTKYNVAYKRNAEKRENTKNVTVIKVFDAISLRHSLEKS